MYPEEYKAQCCLADFIGSEDTRKAARIQELEAEILALKFKMRCFKSHAIQIMDKAIRQGQPFKDLMELAETL